MSCPHTKIVPRTYTDGRPPNWICHNCGRPMKAPPNQIILYDKMLLAINECHQTDEIKDIRDKALAIEHCARIAENFEAERKAAEIRIRAERRGGELLKELEKGKGGRPPENSAQPALSLFAKAKEDAGISDDQAKKWQKLAEIPQEEFEQALKDPAAKPSTTGLIKPVGVFKPLSEIPKPQALPNYDNRRTCTARLLPGWVGNKRAVGCPRRSTVLR